LQVALVSIPPHKFVGPPCWYYRLQKIEKYDIGVFPNGITSKLNFIQIRPAVLEFNHSDRQTDMTSPMRVHFMRIVQWTHRKSDEQKVTQKTALRWRFWHALCMNLVLGLTYRTPWLRFFMVFLSPRRKLSSNYS
jgi:hypothetical protein